VNAGQIIVIGLSVALALWFVLGIWVNRRRARQIWRWLEPGLDMIGGRVGEPWIGRSGAGLRVVIEHTAPPLHRLELIVRLLSRENAPLWVIERAQGKQDEITFRGWLQSPDRREIEAVPAGGGLHRALQAQVDHPWRRANQSSHWAIYSRGGLKKDQLEALQEFIDVYDQQLQRFSKRRSEPHLLVQLSLSELVNESSGQLFERYGRTLGR
jgi:hypothetical protein